MCFAQGVNRLIQSCSPYDNPSVSFGLVVQIAYYGLNVCTCLTQRADFLGQFCTLYANVSATLSTAALLVNDRH